MAREILSTIFEHPLAEKQKILGGEIFNFLYNELPIVCSFISFIHQHGLSLMKEYRHLVLFASLIALSGFFYATYYLCIGDVDVIWEDLLSNIAFVPIELLLVSLILHNILSWHEQRIRRQTLNMTIGAFFYEVGSKFLQICHRFDPKTRKDLWVEANWAKRDFADAINQYLHQQIAMDCERGNLEELQKMLLAKRDFILNMMQNANLLEREFFADMLWALFHLTDEVGWRGKLRNLSAQDRLHLGEDIERAYRLTIVEWLNYMRYLQRAYPFLFGLAVRNNPFKQNEPPRKPRCSEKPPPRTY